MEDALVIDIQPTVHNNVLIYIIQITHQKYIRGFFTTDIGHSFTASNGFRLSSQSCPALYRKSNRVCAIQINGEDINGTWDHYVDMMCMRGDDSHQNNQRMYTDSIVYIEKLKSAVVEYNKHMQGA